MVDHKFLDHGLRTHSFTSSLISHFYVPIQLKLFGTIQLKSEFFT